MTEETIKIQKAIAQIGYCSRRKAEELIAEGRVKVNGQVAHIGQRVDLTTDQIDVNETRLTDFAQKKYWLVYKPVGVVSTTSDELGRKNVLSLLPKKEASPRLYPVGRLDIDSQGLMLLTNDGALTQELTHPSNSMEKIYRVTVLGHPSDLALEHLRSGVKLKEGFTAPATVIKVSENRETTTLDITIHEGRNRQVRRMLRRVGYEEVLLLERRQLGPFKIEHLKGEKNRELAEHEITLLMAQAKKPRTRE